MTDKDAMKLALEALETLMIERGSIYEKAITALKERLAQPEEEPLHPVHIGVDVTREGTAVTAFYRKPDAVMEMFYSQFHPMAQPPQRTWVGLTDEDIGDAYVAWDDTNGASFADFARAIEAKLKQKNGYAEENT